MRKVLAILSLCGLMAILTCPAMGQGVTGSISGVVTDEQGAVIPNAKITVTNRDTSFARELTSGANGSYSVLALEAGNYGIRVEAAGFAARERGATVQVGSSTRVDFLMHVGTQKDVVQVEEAAPQMNYESSAVAGVVTRTQIQDLPLNGRSFLNLAGIEPGVSVSTGGTSQYNAQFSVSILGGSSGRTAYTVDGGNVRDDIENTGPSQNFSQEVVQEFQVNAVNWDLSTGISSVGSINIVTRSGTNQYHGSGYFYFRDHNMAAYPSLQRSLADPNPFFARRNPGFWVGGPVKKDKFFFFFNLESQNQASAVVFVPSTAFPSVSGLGGNFLNPYRDKTLSAKFDYRINDKHTAFARYSHDGNSAFGPAGGAVPESNWLVNSNWSDLTTFGLTSTFTPQLINDFRFNYQYWHNRNLFPTSSDCGGCIGLEGLAPQIQVYQTNVYLGHTSNATQGRDLRQFQFNDTLSWIHGNHRVRGGFEIQPTPGTGFWGYCDPFCAVTASPELIHASLTGPLAAAIPLYFPTLPSRINSIADVNNLPFLGASIGIGDPSQPPPYNIDKAKSNDRYHLFIQDTWKLRPNFTVNYGLAWSYESNLLNFDLPRPAYLAPLYGSDLTPPTNNTHNFSPSLGFNWSPWKNNKTTIHGGFGIYYDTAQLYQRLQERSEIGPLGNGRILQSSTSITNTFPGIIDLTAGGKPVAVGASIPSGDLINMTLGQFETDFTQQIAALTAALQSSVGGAAGLTTINLAKDGTDLYAHKYPMLHSIQMNLGAQREIRHDLVLTVDYVRRVSLNVDLGAYDFNRYNRYINGVRTPVIPLCTGSGATGALSASNPAAECSVGGITFWNPGGRNVYQGILAKLDKRFANRYQFTASYSLTRNSGYDSLYNMDNWNSSFTAGKWGQNLNVVATYNKI